MTSYKNLICIFLSLFLIQKAVTSANSNDFAKLVDIGTGRKIFLKCSGKGSPTILLESGYRNDSDVWTVSIQGKKSIFPAIAAFTRVCVYDRPGTIGWTIKDHSRSDKIKMPRSAESVVQDLHSLLEKAKEPGPYVLVGHSLGGIFVRLYASAYPNEVAGLILVDAYPESFRTKIGKKTWQEYLKITIPNPPGITDPNFENLDFDKVTDYIEEVSKYKPLKPMPLTVLSRGQAAELPKQVESLLTSDEMEKAWQAGQKKLVSLAPNSKQIIATESQHYIQYFQPELIIEAIRTMVFQIRDIEQKK
ncbi:MAG: alpha/beta hydrolase [Tatlockia sp.]|nr:alpha/beta hydrolase [Tatlockia sp.]